MTTFRDILTTTGYPADARVIAGVSDPSAGAGWAEACGQLPEGSLLPLDTVIYGASLTKQVIGAGFALLYRDGMVDPNDSLQQWLPELPRWSERVQLRHLLHHTSGLPDEGPVTERLRALGAERRTAETVLGALRSFPSLDQQPGAAERYCNAGYICLGRVIERASGRALPEFARERLFEPAAMGRSFLWGGPDAIPPGAAPPRANDAGYWPLTLGDGGMWTTVPDLLRWNAAMLRDDLGVSGLIHTPGALNDGTPVAYGWGVGLRTHAGQPMHLHGGGWRGVGSRLVRLPDVGRSIAVVALDDESGRLSALTERLLDTALAP